MPVEPRGLAAHAVFINTEGRGEMTKAPISLQDLRRRLYVKAKTEPTWRFWGLYVHVCKRETLQTAYLLAKANDGAPGVDGVTFAAVETEGVEAFLASKGVGGTDISAAEGTEGGNPERRASYSWDARFARSGVSSETLAGISCSDGQARRRRRNFASASES